MTKEFVDFLELKYPGLIITEEENSKVQHIDYGRIKSGLFGSNIKKLFDDIEIYSIANDEPGL